MVFEEPTFKASVDVAPEVEAPVLKVIVESALTVVATAEILETEYATVAV
jgi:hypothetical protein